MFEINSTAYRKYGGGAEGVWKALDVQRPRVVSIKASALEFFAQRRPSYIEEIHVIGSAGTYLTKDMLVNTASDLKTNKLSAILKYATWIKQLHVHTLVHNTGTDEMPGALERIRIRNQDGVLGSFFDCHRSTLTHVECDTLWYSKLCYPKLKLLHVKRWPVVFMWKTEQLPNLSHFIIGGRNLMPNYWTFDHRVIRLISQSHVTWYRHVTRNQYKRNAIYVLSIVALRYGVPKDIRLLIYRIVQREFPREAWTVPNSWRTNEGIYTLDIEPSMERQLVNVCIARRNVKIAQQELKDWEEHHASLKRRERDTVNEYEEKLKRIKGP